LISFKYSPPFDRLPPITRQKLPFSSVFKGLKRSF
jgi:hypothetical protein